MSMYIVGATGLKSNRGLSLLHTGVSCTGISFREKGLEICASINFVYGVQLVSDKGRSMIALKKEQAANWKQDKIERLARSKT